MLGAGLFSWQMRMASGYCGQHFALDPEVQKAYEDYVLYAH